MNECLEQSKANLIAKQLESNKLRQAEFQPLAMSHLSVEESDPCSADSLSRHSAMVFVNAETDSAFEAMDISCGNLVEMN